MTWNAMAPAEPWEIVDRFRELPSEATATQAQEFAVRQLGWTVDDSDDDPEGRLRNTVAGLSRPHVVTIGEDRLSTVRCFASDLIRDETRESIEFLGDLFTLVVREGARRFGAPRHRHERTCWDVSWDLPDGGGVVVRLLPSSVGLTYYTPYRIERNRKAGYWP
jgi:hypothetical protein